MKSKIFLTVSTLVALLVFGSWTFKVIEEKESLVIKLMLQGLNRSHYKTVSIDDDFSQKAFDLYLERLDGNKRFLLQEDIAQLTGYRDKLDNEAQEGTYQAFELSADLLEMRIKEAQKYFEKVIDKPFDFTKDESVELDPEKMAFAANKKDLADRWRKIVKYQTLLRLNTLLKDQEKAQTSEATVEEAKSMEELEVQARERVKKTFSDYFIRLGKISRKDRRTTYINSIANVFDPHTTYFPPKDKEEFDIDMSGQLEGIGAQLQEQTDGNIKVTRIIPGGPASRDGTLKEEDLILKVAQGDEEPVSIVDMRISDAVRLIRGKKGTQVNLTIQKPDGSTQVLPLTRDIVEIAATYAKSLTVQDENSPKKFGYIHLPRFYFNLNDANGRSCSKDVAKEIEKLQAENVRGIILDLRNNGGGSLNDVVKMAGLFIEEGPIVQVKSRSGEPYIYRDQDPSIQYGGPLVILVNSFSASASEIMAAAMQDYKRAVIIGSPSTYGKGSVQRFLDLDRFIPQRRDLMPLGAVKLTTQKYYRINGGATQLKGVVPDIIVPDTYSYLDMGEKDNDYSMAWDEIDAVNYKSWVSTGVFRKKAIKESKQRISDNPTFALVEENAQRYKSVREDRNYSLNLKTYQQERKDEETEANKYKDILKEIPQLKVLNLADDMPTIESDTTKIKTNEKWLKSIKKDPYVFEAIQVLQDLR